MDEIGGDPGASLLAGSLPARLDAADQLIRKASVRFGPLKPLTEAANLNARGLLLGLEAVLLLLLLPPLLSRLLRRFGLLQPNFRGDRILQSYGVFPVLFFLLMAAGVAYFVPTARSEIGVWTLVIGGFGGLGLLDDVFPDKKNKGLRGHFRAVLSEKRLTTGFVKAVGGLGLALLAGFLCFPEEPGNALLTSALTAFAANALNLLDLRPGRAVGTFLLCALPLLFLAFPNGGLSCGVPPLLLLILPALRIWPLDAAGKVMLGDAGSNPFGAGLGLTFAVSALPLWTKLLALFLLIALHLLAERRSLTEIIAQNPLLRSLDRLTGIRG